ncbi:High-affinity glucose transporter [Pseudocercospora fuligena]|uniref:High-affinity glucose transporter n=1 Tax=Pseudocercospora fuligena TaxID=685502 RepID=A0A8H6RV34_9PEZI|nr:High-affinity glucose transporter [Pseudocercospora fuligena]
MAKGKQFQFRNVYLISGLATLGGLMQGFDVASMSAIIGTQQYKTYFNKPGSVLQGGITASMAGGSLLGSIATNLTGDRFGRRDSLAIGCVVWIIGCVLMAAVQNVAMLIVSRMINGFAVGMFSCQAPLFIAEISKPERRGRLIAFQNWMIGWGTLIIYFISYGTSFIDGNASFRIPWALQMVPAIVMLACIPFMPRSPRWLATKDRWEEAHDVLASLHARGDRYNPVVLAEMHQIKEKILYERDTGSTSWLELVKAKNIMRVQCAICAHLWSQFSGNNALMYYIVYIFQMAGTNGNRQLIAGAIQYCISVGVQVVSFTFMDQYRRRWALMAGSTLLFTWLFAAAGLMANYGHAVPGGLNGVPSVTWVVDNGAASKAIIACAYLFVASYQLTWGPIGWVYPSEVLPMYIRSKTTSIGVGVNWVGNFALTFFTPPAFQNIQWRTFIIFAVFNVTSLFHVFLFFPESKGKTLEEMDEGVFAQSIWAFKIKHTQSRLVEDVAEVQKDVGAAAADLEQLEHTTKDAHV